MLSTSWRHSADGAGYAAITRRPQAIDASELHAKRGEHLADVVVQLAREVLPLLFLRGHELLRELAHQMFGFFRHGPLVLGSALEDAEPDDGSERDDQAKGEASPYEPVQLAAELGVPARDLGALDGVVGVVQLFDLRGDREDRFAPRKHFPPQEAGALADLLDERPIEEWVEGLPVVVELRLEARNPLVLLRTPARQRAQVGDRRDVVLAELGQALAVDRGVLALGVEEVVSDEDAREVHVGAQPAELGLDVALVRVELVELRVDLLGPVRRRQHDTTTSRIPVCSAR